MADLKPTGTNHADSQPSPESILLRQFLNVATGVWLGFFLLFVGLFATYRSPASGVLLGLMGTFVGVTRYARQLASRERILPALLLVLPMFWLIALVLGAAPRGYPLAVASLFCLFPVVVSVAYTSRQVMLRIIAVSVAVSFGTAVFAMAETLIPSTLPEPLLKSIALFAMIGGIGVLSLSLWHSGTRLREVLTEAREKNAALAASERDLERKVEKRTQDLEHAVTEISDLNELAHLVNSTLDLDRVLATMNTALRKLFDFDQLGIFLLDDEGKRLLLDRFLGVSLASDLVEPLKTVGIPLEETDSASIIALKGRAPVFQPDIEPAQATTMSPTDRRIYEASPMKALLLCPLEIEGAAIGTIFFANTRQGFDLAEGGIETVQRYLNILATAIKNSRLFRDAEAARAAALEASQAKSTFLANMSHELRTPLNAIIGYSEMLKEEAGDEGHDGYVPDLDKILTSGRHLLELINGILDLAKIESGKMEIYLEDFDVAETVRGVVGTILPVVRKNDNQLELSGLDHLGSMHCDVTKLRQMLFNLLSNASKFTKQGLVRLELARTSEPDGDWVSFRVIDSGIGMTEEQLGQVFEEFSQADASTTKDYGGTGLGLPITKKFSAMLGGSIVATSEPGQGSTFEIRLPAGGPAAEAARPLATQATEGAPVVLTIDDDPAARELIGRFLDGEGYRMIAAAGGEEGLRIAREQRPDLITLDVMMPHMDGWTVLQELKADPELATIPVILLTMADERNLGFALGASEYMTKPIDREMLGAVLRKYDGGDPAAPALVVDDEPNNRETLRRGLESAGWPVVEAENGQVALERVEEARPRLILLDLMMPVMDGFEFVATLREKESWRSIPVVVLTAKELTDDDRSRLDGHVARVLQKGSLARDELLREVRELVRTRARAKA